MTKVKLQIKDFEDKKTKANKPYSRFQTDKGWMSCFDSDVINFLKKCINGGAVSVETKEKDNFVNIVKHYHGDNSELVDGAKEVLKHAGQQAPVSVQNQIVRMSCLKSACELLNNSADKKGDVLSIAEEMESWVLR